MARTARPTPKYHGQIASLTQKPAPVMKVSRNPYRRMIHPEIVNGQMKYAAK